MISRIAHFCIIPQKGLFLCLSFHPTPKASFWWRCRDGGYKGKLVSHILPSQKPDPKEKQVINLDQDVQVCGYFWWMVYELLCMHYLSLFLSFWIRGYLFFSFLFDIPKHVAYLLWVCIFLFSHSPISLSYFLRERCHTWTWSFILWMDGILLTS